MANFDGRFIWYELATPDPKAAEAFYTKVLGWSAQPMPGATPYTVLSNGTTGLGGVTAPPPGAPQAPGWLIYVATSAIESRIARARSLGGRVVSPAQAIPSVGTIAVLADPQGATFALIEPDGPDSAGSQSPQAGDVSWHELGTADPVAATAFYTALFGWDRLKANDMGPLGIYQEIGRGGVPNGGIYQSPAGSPPPHWLFYVKVDDIHARTEAAKALGATVLHGPAEIPGGDLICQLRDPQGAAFALHQTR